MYVCYLCWSAMNSYLLTIFITAITVQHTGFNNKKFVLTQGALDPLRWLLQCHCLQQQEKAQFLTKVCWNFKNKKYQLLRNQEV